MTTQRFLFLKTQALACRKRMCEIKTTKEPIFKQRLKPEFANGTANGFPIEHLSRSERAQCWERTDEIVGYRTIEARGWLRRNELPRVTLEEHRWLCQNKPGVARWTRIAEYPHDTFVQNSDLSNQARNPIIREVWVGSRSQALAAGTFDTDVEEATGEDLPAGFKKSAGDQEEAAEVTELMTLLYEDTEAFDAWFKQECDNRYIALTTAKPRLKKHRALLLRCIEKTLRSEMPQNKHGELMKVMIEDEHGHRRPIRPGDVITVARGSNDDLDALFLEEADDPRDQQDLSACGSDHRYSDRFRANTDLENSFLLDPDYRIPSSAIPEDYRYNPDEMLIRRKAQDLACTFIRVNNLDSKNILSLTDEIEANLRRNLGDVKFDNNGNLISGYFVGRNEFFASVEEPVLNVRAPRKAAPKPMDWEAVRG